MEKRKTTIDGKFELGGGATLCLYSDREAFTVIDISASGKKISIQRDSVKNISGAMTRNQVWEMIPDPDGIIYNVSLRKDGYWRRINDVTAVVPGKHEYYDYEF